MSLIPPLLAGVLVCPADHGGLTEEIETSRLVCQTCGNRYPVRDGIPVMLLEEAETGD